jgi:hydrogenase/urease accessory protein HupE
MARRYPLIGAAVYSLLCSLVSAIYAHDPGLSAAALRLTDDRMVAHLTLARREIETLVPIDADHDGVVTTEEFTASHPSLQALAPHLMAISSAGQAVSAQITAIELDQSDALHFWLQFPSLPGTQVHVMVPIMVQLARGHRQYVSVRDAQGQLVTERILDAEQASFTVPRTRVAAWSLPSFSQFLFLGVEHILTGYDHLLFLFGLLIMGGSWRSTVRIITSFTVAHSLTLALATFNVVYLPSRIVEPLIAASIIYVGLENLWRQDLQQRWLLTFGFGLIHGLGFATVLRDMGLGESGTVLPLLAFNSGVELGQMAIALLVLPVVWYWQRRPQFFPRLATACSVVVMLVGTYWLCTRTLWA